jgi:putative sporulation protein YyaC
MSQTRIHYQHPGAKEMFRANFEFAVTTLNKKKSQIVFICVGTDRSTGDSLGPLVGSFLKQKGLLDIPVYGTLESPVHAMNLEDTIREIKFKHPGSFIVAIDACLGRSESVGYISIKEGTLKPGTGVDKNLPEVGDVSIIGIVNVGGFMEYMVLQNTKLGMVMSMANVISDGIVACLKEIRGRVCINELV